MGREGEEGGYGLEGCRMSWREPGGVVTMLGASEYGLVVDGVLVPGIPYHLNISSGGE